MFKGFHSAGSSHGCGSAYQKQYFMPHFAKGGYRRPKYNVPMNVVESETAYEVHVFAVGFGKEHISLTVVDDVLYISGTKTIETSPNFTRQEFPVKNFERTLNLNGQVDVENISAKSENGVLIVSLPKTKEAQKKEYKVEVK